MYRNGCEIDPYFNYKKLHSILEIRTGEVIAESYIDGRRIQEEGENKYLAILADESGNLLGWYLYGHSEKLTNLLF